LWPTRSDRADELDRILTDFSKETRPLPGVMDRLASRTLAWQMIASIRRLDYTKHLKARPISQRRTDPADSMFDPERAALWYARANELDEAFWLLFLSIHFGKHGTSGWARLRDVYSGLGQQKWTWERTSADPTAFTTWLSAHQNQIGGAFGNHRKYETLKDSPGKGTASVLASYIDWVGPARSHRQLVATLVKSGGNDPRSIFDQFYKSMNVARFGRLARFDFLALVGRLDLAPIEPGSAYLLEATGPKRGARLLFLGDTENRTSDKSLDEWVLQLGDALSVGMQVMEDSLCNWQKSSTSFVHFTG
jgi:Alpha-glutamyl/putrescinyl thymine pyrophosphorylase clade 3